jgi:hypothetical protein
MLRIEEWCGERCGVAACRSQHLAKRNVKPAKLGLRGIVTLTVVRKDDSRVVDKPCQSVASVPDRVRDRSLLRDEQQRGEKEPQGCSLYRHDEEQPGGRRIYWATASVRR